MDQFDPRDLAIGAEQAGQKTRREVQSDVR